MPIKTNNRKTNTHTHTLSHLLTETHDYILGENLKNANKGDVVSSSDEGKTQNEHIVL